MPQFLLWFHTFLMPRRRSSIPCQISRMTSRRTVSWVKSANSKFFTWLAQKTSPSHSLLLRPRFSVLNLIFDRFCKQVQGNIYFFFYTEEKDEM